MFIVWFNTKYQRQFEVVAPNEEWDELRREYGVKHAAALLISTGHRVKRRDRMTPKSQRSAQAFVMGSLVRPDVYGEATFKIGRSKKAVLDRGHAELMVVSTGRSTRVIRRKGRRTLYPR